MSVEVDILPIADSNEETARLVDLIEGVAGEFSTLEQLHGFGIDGVDLETAVLDGWRDRLVKVQNANTAAPAGEPRFTGWCLDKEDLCVARLCVLREKDRNLVPHFSTKASSTATSSRPPSAPCPTSTPLASGHARGWPLAVAVEVELELKGRLTADVGRRLVRLKSGSDLR